MMHISIGHFWPKSLPLDQNRSEVRIYAAIMTALFIYFMMESGLSALTVPQTPLFKVVSLSHHPHVTALAFFICVAMVIPHVLTLVFFPGFLSRKEPRLIASYGARGCALLWFYFANLARPLDFGELPYFYMARAVLCLLVAAVFAYSLNSQQLREVVDGKQ